MSAAHMLHRQSQRLLAKADELRQGGNPAAALNAERRATLLSLRADEARRKSRLAGRIFPPREALT